MILHTLICKDRDDTLLWKDEEGDSYKIRSAYCYPLEVKALPSTQHFAWRVLINRITTNDNLSRRGILRGSNLCVMCGNADESSNHLFFSCKIAWSVWNQCHR